MITEAPAIITPAFVIDEHELSLRVAAFQEAMDRVWPGGIIGYSVKTGPTLFFRTPDVAGSRGPAGRCCHEHRE